jgi:UDP-N-acetylglucosamine 2-epimerase (non-hydrolysing)
VAVKVLSVVGARPQFVKLAPIDQALRKQGIDHVIVHTGQHYDPLLSQSFFDDLAIPPPVANLGVGSASHAVQTAAVLVGLDGVLVKQDPDWVLVYGDTNSTLGAALAAAQHQYSVAHVEAGLRSFDRRMPEERNRVVTDHLSDLLLAPTRAALAHLAAEGLAARSVIVGDVMVDSLAMVMARVTARPPTLPPALRDGPFLLATLHRAETTDQSERLAATLAALASSPLPVKLLAHPRLTARAHQFDLPLTRGAVEAVEPLPYPAMIAAMQSCSGLITDSGGLQKEALLLGVPCTTIRAVTEWPETLDGGWNVLVPEPAGLASALTRPRPRGDPPKPYGDGRAAARVVAELLAHGPAVGS